MLSAPGLARKVAFSNQIGAGVEFVNVVLHLRSNNRAREIANMSQKVRVKKKNSVCEELSVVIVAVFV